MAFAQAVMGSGGTQTANFSAGGASDTSPLISNTQEYTDPSFGAQKITTS